jgi:acetyl-CoA carboxylase carboxyltransferase component
LAASADFLIASQDGELFLTAPAAAKAADCSGCNSGSAAYAAENGLVHILTDDEAAAIKQARKLLSVLPLNNLSAAPLYEYSEPAALADGADAKTAIASIADADSVIEISEGYGPAVVTAFATVAGSCVGFVATDKAADALNSAACEKATHFIKVCDAYGIPVISLVDTDGFKRTACPSLIKAGANLANVYAEATCAKINVITGNAIGAAYIALAGTNANADVTFAWPNAVISALPVETAVEFSMTDRMVGCDDAKACRAALEEEYADTVASAFNAAQDGYITNVIAPADTRAQVITALDMLSGKRVSKLPKKHTTL